MNCDEIKIYLHDFADGVLDENLRPEIESHISKCENCRNHYLALIRLFDVIETHHENIIPPADFIEKMYGELLARSSTPESVDKAEIKRKKKIIEKEKLEQEINLKMMSAAARKSAVTRSNFTRIVPQNAPSVEFSIKKVLLILLPLVLLAVAYFITDFMKYNSPWRIVAVEGNYFVNGKHDTMNKLSTGKTVLTGNNSVAIVNVPQVGKLNIGANTTFTILKAKDGDNIVGLRRGSVKVESLADVPFFTIELRNVAIHDRGGIFSVITDDFDNTSVTVNIGNVAIEKDGNFVFLSDGYTCTIDNKSNIGIPYRTDAQEGFKSAVKSIEEGKDLPTSVQTLVSEVRQQDVLTLIGVISKVDKPERKILYDTINALFPSPAGVTEKGILSADEDMLQAWWDEIEWQL